MMLNDSGPDKRMMAMGPVPGGVAMAQMVSVLVSEAVLWFMVINILSLGVRVRKPVWLKG